MSKALVETNEWESIKRGLPCWTGTMTAYARPGEKLGSSIEYTDPRNGQKYVFPVPVEYQNERDAILVSEYPNWTLVPRGNAVLVHASEVDCIMRFPQEDGWHKGDPRHDIPSGDRMDDSDGISSAAARYLWRVPTRVGLAARDKYYPTGTCFRRVVNLSAVPSFPFGVVAKGDFQNELDVSEEGSKVVVRGTPEQLAVVAGILRGLNEKP
jgi:hypothetical protein